MKIYWKKLANDLADVIIGFIRQSLIVLAIIGLIVISPVAFPVAAFIVYFQKHYTDSEPNEYLKAYVGLLLTVIAAALLGSP